MNHLECESLQGQKCFDFSRLVMWLAVGQAALILVFPRFEHII